MKFAQRERENTPWRATIYLLDTMKRRKRARGQKNVYEREEGSKRHVSVCPGRSGEERRKRNRVSLFLGRLLICHASTLRPLGRPSKQKWERGWFCSFAVDMDVTRCLIVSAMRGRMWWSRWTPDLAMEEGFEVLPVNTRNHTGSSLTGLLKF